MSMKKVTYLLAALAILGGIFAFRTRDWGLISLAHEEGNLHSFATVLARLCAPSHGRGGGHDHSRRLDRSS